MKTWPNEILRNDDPELNGGGGVGDDNLETLFDDSGGGGGDDSQQGGDDGQQQQQQAQVPSQPALDPNALADAIARGLRGAIPQQQPPGMSDEDYDKRTSRYKASPELLQRILEHEDPAERVKALQELIDGSSTHAVVVSQLLYQQSLRQLEERFQPLMAQRQEQLMKSFENDIATKYPSLKGQTKILQTVVNELRSRGWQPKSDSEAVQTVASAMEALIKSVNPQFNLNGGGSKGNSGMASMTAGHGSGARSGGGSGGKKPGWAGVF